MTIMNLGISHRIAPPELLEQLADRTKNGGNW
jgi:hypothetical protein